MNLTIQVRLDAQTLATLRRLERQLGWSSSRVVREGLRLMDARYGKLAPQRIIGIECFGSGVPDLGSNKKHMEGFGTKLR